MFKKCNNEKKLRKHGRKGDKERRREKDTLQNIQKFIQTLEK